MPNPSDTAASSSSSSNAEQTASMRDCVLGLLATTMPPERYAAETDPEVLYLKPFYERYQMLTPDQWLQLIETALAQARATEESMVKLIRGQKLSLLESVVMFLCYQVESDPMAGRCIAYLQNPFGGSRPTLSLLNVALSPLQDNVSGAANSGNFIAEVANGRAVQLELLQILNASLPLPERAVQIPAALALVFSPTRDNWPGARIGLAQSDFELPTSIRKQCKLQAKIIRGQRNRHLVIRGASTKEAEIAANTIASFLKLKPVFIDDLAQAMPALGSVSRELKLLPVLSYDCGPGEQIQLPVIKGYTGPVLVIAGIDGAFDSADSIVTSWNLPKPTYEERRKLWMSGLKDRGLADKLAADHVHSTQRIVELADLTRHHCAATRVDKPTIEDVREAAWLSESSGLAALAQPISVKVVDEALVVRKYTQDELNLLEQRCRLREHLGDNLGITLKARYQMGVKVLFTGPSGTGKTLAASWLATKLGLPLYRVDLASITSKFVGETEKQLAKLLSQAEQEEVILLFDEADSLFGKRTDVKDANDRYANAQTNYLLQRVETYSGIIVLTSNSKARFDTAFTRRLDSIIAFSSPNPEERRLIWLRHLGTHHNLTRAQINQLSVQCDFSGGHIRNVVLSAAVISEKAERKICIRDIVMALVFEYKKLGRQMPPELKVFTPDEKPKQSMPENAEI